MELNTKLKETKNQILQYFELPGEDLNKSYGAGKWNIRQILIHLTDAEAVLLERIKRTIAKPGQTIMAFDQDKWAQELEYDHFPLTLAAALYSANRNVIIYLAERFYLEKGDHTYQHNEAGERSLKDEFDKVLWHCEDHIKQIEKALKS